MGSRSGKGLQTLADAGSGAQFDPALVVRNIGTAWAFQVAGGLLMRT
jgi:hypothetical protein